MKRRKSLYNVILRLGNFSQKKKLTKFVFEMNIDNQKKKLIIHQNDNIDLRVKQFCNENNLDLQSKSRIISAIKEKFNFNN